MRGRAILVAWVLSVQTIAPSLALASTARAGCCCAQASAKKCHCPGCSKVRAIEEGHGLVGGCGHDEGKALATFLVVAGPVRSEIRAGPTVAPRTQPPVVATPPFPIEEVPTPPPLA